MTTLSRVALVTSVKKRKKTAIDFLKRYFNKKKKSNKNWFKGSAYMHEGPFKSRRYWQVPWIQKSLYFFRHGFLFLPFPFPFAFFLPSPFLAAPSSFSPFKTALGSLGLLENATVLVGEEMKCSYSYYNTISDKLVC